MTTGYICDRCGETFTGGGRWLQGGYHGSTAIMHRWDLCPDCMEGFTGWMERGLMAEAPEESADCVRDGDAVSDIHESAREHSLESESVREQSESVREQHYESQDVTGSAGCVTDDGEMLHDTREKLEEDVRGFYDEHECDELLSMDFIDVIYSWLDRQAAITEKACADFWQEIAEDRDKVQMKCAELCDQVDALTKQRDDLRIYRDTWERTAHLHEKDIERLIEERDQWKDAYEDSERMRLELVEQVEYHEALISRLKQRRGELMEQVRKLQDVAARDRLNGI